jgi:DNA-binding protein HU-beta
MEITEATTKRMTQSEIINYFSEKLGLKKSQVKDMFDELANLAVNEVQSNDQFVVPGFGKLVLTHRQAREGRNPATGEPMSIPAKTSLKFRLNKSIKDSVITSEEQSL